MSYRASLMAKYSGRCFYCQAKLFTEEATADHFIPRSRGGQNYADNRVLSCAPCNNAKGNFNPVSLGIWHPEDTSGAGQRALQRLRLLVIRRQLPTSEQRRKIQAPFRSLPVRPELKYPFPDPSKPEATAAMASEKPEPVFDAFSVERTKGRVDAFVRPDGAAWPAESNNGAVDLVLNVLPVNGTVLLVPHKPRDKPPQDE